MGGSYSCPEGYEMLKQSVYKDSVRLCLQKQSLRFGDDPTNHTFITDIVNPAFSASSGADERHAQWVTFLCLLAAILFLTIKN
jgi:hypothetical protein